MYSSFEIENEKKMGEKRRVAKSVGRVGKKKGGKKRKKDGRVKS